MEKTFQDLLRGITAALPEAPRPASFLRDYLFTAPEFFASGDIDVAQFRSSRGLATATPRGAPGNFTEKTGYSGRVVTPPSFKPKKLITALDLTKRLPGEGVTVNGQNRNGAMSQLAAQLIDELDQEISRAEILQGFQALQDATINIYGATGDVIGTISTGRDSSLNVANVTTTWTNASSDPLADVNKEGDATQKLSGFPADYVICGQAAANAAMAHATVQKALSKDWSVRGELDNALQASGARRIGYIDGRTWWTLPDYYRHPKTGVLTAYVNTNRFIVGSTMAGLSPLYALVDDVENPVAAERSMKAWPEKDPSGYVYQMLSAALVFPKNPNAHGCKTAIF